MPSGRSARVSIGLWKAVRVIGAGMIGRLWLLGRRDMCVALYFCSEHDEWCVRRTEETDDRRYHSTAAKPTLKGSVSSTTSPSLLHMPTSSTVSTVWWSSTLTSCFDSTAPARTPLTFSTAHLDPQLASIHAASWQWHARDCVEDQRRSAPDPGREEGETTSEDASKRRITQENRRRSSCCCSGE